MSPTGQKTLGLVLATEHTRKVPLVCKSAFLRVQQPAAGSPPVSPRHGQHHTQDHERCYHTSPAHRNELHAPVCLRHDDFRRARDRATRQLVLQQVLVHRVDVEAVQNRLGTARVCTRDLNVHIKHDRQERPGPIPPVRPFSVPDNENRARLHARSVAHRLLQLPLCPRLLKHRLPHRKCQRKGHDDSCCATGCLLSPSLTVRAHGAPGGCGRPAHAVPSRVALPARFLCSDCCQQDFVPCRAARETVRPSLHARLENGALQLGQQQAPAARRPRWTCRARVRRIVGVDHVRIRRALLAMPRTPTPTLDAGLASPARTMHNPPCSDRCQHLVRA
mmetsp:Transcript_5154/g.11422  ORF Transcript_5154/g.11422 Transcript_5154/m.11422 type:complete len:334 (-) Transcript_5154:582-1583(-)